jgi:amidohydrolase
MRDTIQKNAAALKHLALRIHRHPELGYQERKACAWQVSFLRERGFRVVTPLAGIATAYRAAFGQGRPVFCFTAEYDALPGLGHACGHNLICTAALGAGVALAAQIRRERIPGIVVVMGTPAEELQGGKVRMLKSGAFKGVDAVLMAHPSDRTMADSGHSAVTRFDVAFHGRSVHAAAASHKGLNALDAVMLMFHGINAWRQQLPESSRIHGIVRRGGDAPNIIPDLATCSFYLRSPDDRVLAAMVRRFARIVRGAALMTGTRFEISPPRDPYRAGKPNGPLNAAWLDAAGAAGLRPIRAASLCRASTDFSDVQQVVPGSHVYFAISRRGVPIHSTAFRQAAQSSYGLRQTLQAAEAMSRVGYRFLTDAGFRREVRAAFEGRSVRLVR